VQGNLVFFLKTTRQRVNVLYGSFSVYVQCTHEIVFDSST